MHATIIVHVSMHACSRATPRARAGTPERGRATGPQSFFNFFIIVLYIVCMYARMTYLALGIQVHHLHVMDDRGPCECTLSVHVYMYAEIWYARRCIHSALGKGQPASGRGIRT